MSLTTCKSCEKEFLTEADPYVVLPKPSGTIIMCLKCATRVAHRQGWEQAKREAFEIARTTQIGYIQTTIAAMECKEKQMTDSEKLARWQGWSRTNGDNWINPFTKMTCFENPDYLNDDAAAMSLLDTLVEKGYDPVLLLYYRGKSTWNTQIFDGEENCVYPMKPTRREAVVAACLELIDRENTDDPTR